MGVLNDTIMRMVNLGFSESLAPLASEWLATAQPKWDAATCGFKQALIGAGLRSYSISLYQIVQGLGVSLLTPRVSAEVSVKLASAIFGFSGGYSIFLHYCSGADEADILGHLVNLNIVRHHFSELTNETFYEYTEMGRKLIRDITMQIMH